MITNLFSSFEPSTFFLKINWLRATLFIIFVPLSFWLIPSRISILWISLTIKFYNEFKIITKIKRNYLSITFISLFLFILINNFLGLFPYIFTSSSHITFTFSIALPLWLTFIIFGWINNIIHIFTHLIPQGTPFILIPFMVCIETVRNIIRPGTLAIRLSANIIAGHLLLTLLGNARNTVSLISLNLIILIQLLLLILESAVSIIQAYVFSILRILYLREI
jgi:F0F1-type ATP synthase, subunit a